ncbi:OmpA/MotB family protein [Anaeromyxobacter dehalogenans]|uniref:Outer membrane protein, OmpA/MotB family n=1 Tax=Anaeromyxobacter dehalogenans (strain 2CP-C) TaxID=290397 RepID=Q2IQS5_ANADE|nr:flagellar motor protein MotB [Anaeromyxobacter dehalogenans]ABC81158.1 outer membrane protein, OmpA/MotB family [Anaeromyxobacter dehalogenans 2CP-C]
MARRRREEEHENHERWLVSYADFMTLLFAFFVVMYAVSRVDNKRIVQATESIRWAMHFSGTGGTGALPLFDGPPSEGGGPALEAGTSMRQEHRGIELLRKRIERRVRPFVMERRPVPVVSVLVEGRRLTVRLAATEFFDPGQAALRPQALAMLDAIAAELVPLARPLRVEGHTDETPVGGGGRWISNWELSAARAATVVGYLEQAHAARPAGLSAVGLGSAHPLSTDATPEAHERNRRVELVLELDPHDELLGAAAAER